MRVRTAWLDRGEGGDCRRHLQHGRMLVMFTYDDDPLACCDDGPSSEEIERVVLRALRRYGHAPGDPEDDTPPRSAEEIADSLTSTLRRCGLLASPPPAGKPHHLASAGPRLKDLRDKSGWTVEEIAERTGMPLGLLEAFENGDSAAAGELTSFKLECLAAACCGTLADLLGPEHSWVKAARRRDSRPQFGRSIAVDPHG